MDARRARFLSRPLLVAGLLLALLGGSGAALALDIQDEILVQVASIRGLQPKGSVPFDFVDGSTLRSNLIESFENDTSLRELETSRKLLVLLGLLSPDADLHGMLLDLYAENIAGYYNHHDKKMYVVSGRSSFGPEQKLTLAHEFTHALQDQYFDLEKVEAATEENGDYSLAVQALMEGDATLTMVIYARRFLSPEELFQLQISGAAGTLDQAPLVVRNEVVFPYDEGALFVFRLWQEGGFEAVDRAFSDPPRSTEQVIHPEKYLAREPPIEVTLPDLAAALGPGWSLLRSDLLGELDLRILLQQFSDEETASRGAAGWGGDRFALLENAAGQNALVVNTVWDSEREAGEFFNLYGETVGRRYGRRASRTEEVPSKIVWTTPNGSLLLEKWGSTVAIIMGPDAGVTNTLVSAIAPTSGPAAQPGPVRAPGPAPAPVQAPR